MTMSQDVVTLFAEELLRRNIPIQLDKEGGFVIEAETITSTIHLDNLSRDYERNPDPEIVHRFIDTILKPIETPTWDEVKHLIRWQPEPRTMPIDEALHDIVSSDVALVLVYVSDDGTRIAWISKSTATQWNKEKGELFAVATQNMGQLLNAAVIETTQVVNHNLGMIATSTIAFKAALLFHPMLRQKVEPVLGWPVFAVMPCRDFVYIIAEKDQELLGKLASVVVQEFSESAYPLTAEVFQLTDTGIKAIGTFQQAIPDEEYADHDDGTRTVTCCHGQLSFRIPGDWVETHDEDGQGIFFNEDEQLGTLWANVLSMTKDEPITPAIVEQLAREAKTEHPLSSIEDLDDGVWLVEYSEEIDKDGEISILRTWMLYHPVMPNRIQVAVLTFDMPIDLVDVEDLALMEGLEILERELRACRFHD